MREEQEVKRLKITSVVHDVKWSAETSHGRPTPHSKVSGKPLP